MSDPQLLLCTRKNPEEACAMPHLYQAVKRSQTPCVVVNKTPQFLPLAGTLLPVFYHT